jgi:DNA-binding CsgD family transcriptional regulator
METHDTAPVRRMTRRRFTDTRLRELWASELTASEVADVLGVSMKTLYQHVGRLGLEGRGRTSRLAAEIVRLSAAGMTRRHIQNHLGVSRDAVIDALAARQGDPDVDRLKADGLTVREIARALDVSERTVWRRLRSSRSDVST